MLARLQRRALALLVAAAAAWYVLLSMAGHPGWAWAGAVAISFGHALVLAVEFVLLRCVHGDDPAPRAGFRTLLRAWATECGLAILVFGWRQPFRARAVNDVPGRRGVRGIVFVHGYLCNRGLWTPWIKRCRAAGRPCKAIDLEPVFSPLDAYVLQLEQAVSRLEEETGMAPLLVCHSMGGLVARAWMAAMPCADARVHHVITIGTPHRGTWLARFSCTANSLHMRAACEWLRQLKEREPTDRAQRFTCFYSNADNIVFPPRAAVLQGAMERHVAGAAHVALAFHPQVYREVFRRLEDDVATTPLPAVSGSRS